MTADKPLKDGLSMSFNLSESNFLIRKMGLVPLSQGESEWSKR
jgi:hypothetical protein